MPYKRWCDTNVSITKDVMKQTRNADLERAGSAKSVGLETRADLQGCDLRCLPPTDVPTLCLQHPQSS